MRTIKFFLLSIVFISLNTIAQIQDSSVIKTAVISTTSPHSTLNGIGNNELKINLAMCVAGLPEITYERYIAENMGIGLSASISVDTEQDYNAILLPYYRLYFGNKQKTTFFIEGSMAVINEKYYDYVSYSDPYYSQMFIKNGNRTNFGFGAAAGLKFLTKNNFIGELYLGAGRIFGNYTTGGFPRIGITLGKRF